MPGTPPPPPWDTWLWDSSPVPPNRPAIPMPVYRYNGSATPPTLTPLSNVQCVGMTWSLGTDPGHARFRYVFDGRDSNAPQSIEQALGTTISLPKTINPGDELLVIAAKPNTTDPQVLFYGTALLFGMNLDPAVEDVHVIATGYSRVAWNTPIDGYYLRDSISITDGKDFQTDLPAQFNPKGEPNATPPEAYVNASADDSSDWKYPTFLDWKLARSPDVRKKWTLAMAVRYLVYRHMDPASDITYPTGDVIDALFVSLEPVDGRIVDPNDATSYTTKDITVSDKPITGRDWPTVLNELIRDKGFWMRWVPYNAASGDDPAGTITPKVYLQFGRVQGTIAPVDVYLPPRGSALDPQACNVSHAQVDRDTNQVINSWKVVGATNRYEASFVLAPGFPMQASDSASLAQLATYDKNSMTFDTHNDDYRLFVFDETAEGNYLPGTNTPTAPTTAGDFTPVLGDLAGSTDTPENETWNRRRRPGIGDLISEDEKGKPRRYSLAIAKDSTQAAPAVWDGTGTWQEIDGGYQLLKDRLGILITTDNPNAWNIGKSRQVGAPYPNGIVQVVQALATAGAANFKLRLTCVIEGDRALVSTTARTAQSPLTEVITRIIDARDRLKLLTVHSSSPWNAGGTGSTSLKPRDDTDDAKAEADAARIATEAGILEGRIVIPRFTASYKPGDRIRQINGRGLGFRTDGGAIGATPVYPVVTSVRWDLQGGQATTLQISDQDGHRHKIEPKIKRK